jgi:uncharacterized cupin superfamily protein
MITHWDDVPETRREQGHIAGTWQALTGDSSITVGVRRLRVDPGKWATPLHLEGSEEEIFYVLAGTGISLQTDGPAEEAYAVAAGDCLVHLALEHAHTIQGGPEGLDVLAFGQRSYAANTLLPRADVSWLGPTWVRRGAPEDHPWAREAAVGPPIVGELSPRPRRIVAVDAVEPVVHAGATVRCARRDLGVAAGSLRTGLQHARVEPGAYMAPPHSHSAEEEILVVLEGSGTVELWPSPRYGGDLERFAVRAGSTIARPAGSTRPHGMVAGPEGMTVLAYGTRHSHDVCYYPRSGKISFRGVGVIGRLVQDDYWDGED